ncbi:unnamed protein product [Pseudo-nitzschia multistriata]|uniref:WW domain-containing protein n=1 Tax=Pseudo-nitzschia multistriata TaxID=183589 RepID=A0A448YYL0_9STRA|nr:unnamed protein product [Pseudo-nitzschia multistriata]
MLAWASDQIEKISQTVAPPPTDAAGRFSYAVSRNDENSAMGCIAAIDPIQTVVNQSKGWFPIHMACQYSMVRLVRLLMNQPGLSIQQPDYSGCTPLHHACMSTQRSTALEVVKMLITEYQADPCAKNSQGQTPYDLATLDSIRQYLLPIQLQRETQHALDNGGVGLAPGIDLGGLKINRSNMAPPPQFGGAGLAAAPVVQSQTPGPAYAATPTPSAHPAPAPASVPSRRSSTRSTSSDENSRYSRTGGSSLAVYSKYKADGFHSSSSDVNLQRKYGHAGANESSSVEPPPNSGNAPSSGNLGPNPFSGAMSLSGTSRYASYGQTAAAAPAPASGPAYGYVHPGAGTTEAPKFFIPGAAAAPTPAASEVASSFMPPPPYSGVKVEAPAASPTAGASPAVASPFATPGPAANNLFDSPPGAAAPTLESEEPKGEPQPQQQSAIPTEAESGADAAESDWVETTDPASGQTYYFNTKTNETSWDNPNAATTATEQESTGDSDWAELVDPSSGQTYYYNEKTGETSWEKPATSNGENTGAATDATRDMEPSQWVEATDPGSGNTYYYNSTTGETSWEKPAELNAEPESPGKENAQGDNAGSVTDPVEEPKEEEPSPAVDAPSDPVKEEADATAEGAESPWSEATDPNTGNTYYYNSVTGETSWEKPVEMKAEQESQSTTVDDTTPPEETEGDDAGTATDPAEEPKEEESAPEVDPPSEPVKEEANTPHEEETKATKEEVVANEAGTRSPWSEAADPSTGKTYYYNSVTGETSWEKPAELNAEQESPSTEDTPGDNAASVTDPVEEPKEEETSPEVDTPSDPVKEEADATPENKTEATEEEVSAKVEGTKSPWSEAADPSTGKTYYYNSVTGETSWEKPAEFEDEKAPVIPDTATAEETTANNAGANNPVEEATEEKKTEEETSPEVDTPSDTVKEEADATPENKTEATEEEVSAKEVATESPWSEAADPSTGKTYYYNSVTGETSWEKPAELSLAADTTTPEEAEANETATSSHPVDEVTEEKPNAEVEKSQEEPKSDGAGDLAQGWQEVQDPNTGKCYYFNQETQETTWEKPTVSSTEVSGTDDAPSSSDEQNDWVETLDPSSGKSYYYNTKTCETTWEKTEVLSGQKDSASATTDDATGVANASPVEDTSAPPAVENSADSVESSGVQANTSPFGKGHVRDQSAEDIFASPPVSDGPPASFPVAAPGQEPTVSESVATTAQDLFGAGPATTEASEPAKTTTEEENLPKPPLSSECAEDTSEMEDGEMTDIPLSPEPVMLNKAAKKLPDIPDIPSKTEAPAATEPVAAPTNDLFAAIGMPPPPFQSRR